MYGEIDFLELLTEQNKKRKHALELRQQLETEMNLVKQKHKKILDEYRPAYEEMQRMQGEFNKKWDTLLASYNKEVRVIVAKYKRMAKEL